MVAWPWCYFGTEKKKKALNYQQGCELQPIFKEPYVNFYFLFFFFPSGLFEMGPPLGAELQPWLFQFWKHGLLSFQGLWPYSAPWLCCLSSRLQHFKPYPDFFLCRTSLVSSHLLLFLHHHQRSATIHYFHCAGILAYHTPLPASPVSKALDIACSWMILVTAKLEIILRT